MYVNYKENASDSFRQYKKYGISHLRNDLLRVNNKAIQVNIINRLVTDLEITQYSNLNTAKMIKAVIKKDYTTQVYGKFLQSCYDLYKTGVSDSLSKVKWDFYKEYHNLV